MDKTAFYQLSYGLYLLTVKSGERENGCIVNTVIQCASDPLRLSVCVINKNLTCEMLRETGRFNVSVLPETTPFGLFRHYGMQSGRDTDKFAGDDATPRLALNGLRYLPEHANAVLSCEITEVRDLGASVLFIADVVEAKVLSKESSCTYDFYHAHIKPKKNPAPERKECWVCKVCGYVYEGAELPDDFVCPLCKHPRDDFERAER